MCFDVLVHPSIRLLSARTGVLMLHAGAVGINIEDSTTEGGALRPVDVQCERIGAVRDMADEEGIPLVINARIDVFMREAKSPKSDMLSEAIERSKAYLDAGADCVYPITLGDIESLKKLRADINAPINVYATNGTASLRALEDAGISRVSLGPNFFKASLTAMRNVAEKLLSYGSYDSFTQNVVSTEEIQRFVSNERMKQ